MCQSIVLSQGEPTRTDTGSHLPNGIKKPPPVSVTVHKIRRVPHPQNRGPPLHSAQNLDGTNATRGGRKLLTATRALKGAKLPVEKEHFLGHFPSHLQKQPQLGEAQTGPATLTGIRRIMEAAVHFRGPQFLLAGVNVY